MVKQYDLDTANKLPCDYFDSINITGGIQQGDDYVFRNMTFSKGQYATVNSMLSFTQTNPDDGKFIRVAPYQRGCLNKNKKYIRLCCKDGCPNDGYEYNELDRWNLEKYTKNQFEYVTETCGRLTEKIDQKNVIIHCAIFYDLNNQFN